MPVRLAVDDAGEPILVSVDIAGEDVKLRTWRAEVGSVQLLLLDAHIPGNTHGALAITNRLYGGDNETRIFQEIVLGVGASTPTAHFVMTPPSITSTRSTPPSAPSNVSATCRASTISTSTRLAKPSRRPPSSPPTPPSPPALTASPGISSPNTLAPTSSSSACPSPT